LRCCVLAEAICGFQSQIAANICKKRTSQVPVPSVPRSKQTTYLRTNSFQVEGAEKFRDRKANSQKRRLSSNPIFYDCKKSFTKALRTYKKNMGE